MAVGLTGHVGGPAVLRLVARCPPVLVEAREQEKQRPLTLIIETDEATYLSQGSVPKTSDRP